MVYFQTKKYIKHKILYMIILTCYLQILQFKFYSSILLSVHTVKISTPRIGKILTVDISLLILYYLGALET